MVSNKFAGEAIDSNPWTAASPSTSATSDSPEDMLTEFNPRDSLISRVPAVVVVEGSAG